MKRSKRTSAPRFFTTHDGRIVRLKAVVLAGSDMNQDGESRVWCVLDNDRGWRVASFTDPDALALARGLTHDLWMMLNGVEHSGVFFSPEGHWHGQ